jgi:hypothetical protein
MKSLWTEINLICLQSLAEEPASGSASARDAFSTDRSLNDSMF